MKKFLTTDFWFYGRAGALEDSIEIGLLIVIVLFIVAFFVLKRVKIRNISPAIIKRVRDFFVVNAIIGALLLFLTYQEIPYLSARVWFLIWLAEILVYIGYLMRFSKRIKLIRQSAKGIDEYRKYLP